MSVPRLFGRFPTETARKLELEVQKFCYAQHYSRSFLVDAHEGWQRSIMPDGFERRLVHYVYGRSHEATYSHPADWWQALKVRFAPRWFLKRWPARLKTVTFDAKALVPELKVLAERHIVAYFGELRE